MKKTLHIIRRIYVLPLLIIMPLIFVSCNEDLLHLAPVDALSESTVFDTPDRIEKLLFGLYDGMKQRGYYGSRIVVFSDIRGNEFLNESQNTGNGLQVWNHTLESSFQEVNEVWGAVYYTINSCNIFLSGIQENRASIGDDVLAQQYEGEAKFIRALSYFHLLSLYARPFADGSGSQLGVVLRLEPQPGGEKDQARATVGEVYDLILSDLNFAIQHLPAEYGDEYVNTTRAHRNTAIAIKTRVLLSMGNYEDLITEANQLVSQSAPFSAASGVPHALEDQISDVFSPPYTTLENMFSLPNSSNDPLFNQGALASFYRPGPTGFGDFSLNPEGIIGHPAYDSLDHRRGFVEINPDDSKPYLSKFPTGQPFTDYVPVIRYAEVLLNLSEAIARSCNCVDARALSLLNAVRVRSNPEGEYIGFSNVEEFLDALLIERRIEFLGEGLGSLDITRLLLPFQGKDYVPTIDPSQSEYLWPIPINELAANDLCEPNP